MIVIDVALCSGYCRYRGHIVLCTIGTEYNELNRRDITVGNYLTKYGLGLKYSIGHDVSKVSCPDTILVYI